MDLVKYIGLFHDLFRHDQTLYSCKIEEIGGIPVENIEFIGSPSFMLNTKLLEVEHLIEMLEVLGINDTDIDISNIVNAFEDMTPLSLDKLDRYRRLGKAEYVSYDQAGILLGTFKMIKDKIMEKFKEVSVKVDKDFIFYGDGVPMVFIKGVNMDA